ncbi:maleylacetoacetate isomerase [Marinomonas mediterranea]|uniref:maleylacetoacetate isomerase n=1 Tax=Marinomonas mediterranea TaxID=119864 RepID=UPI002349AAC2|nr:maleylacetoacetate isomerase [Marinomonas mediterranea]WCN09604.1 maleylacetoacetate isomerase [Marinomonas mediterranea]
MQLYSFFNSSTSYRVRIALAIKGLAYDYQGVNIRIGDQLTEEHIARNPSKGVPVLILDDGQRLTQSMAILDYLERTYPTPALLPDDPQLRTRVLEVANVIACDMHAINNLRSLGYLKNVLDISDKDKKVWYQHWVNQGLTAVETLLERHGVGPFCFGDQPTLADCCLVPQVANSIRFGCSMSDFPNVMAVYEHCQQQAAFQEAEPQRQPDFIE